MHPALRNAYEAKEDSEESSPSMYSSHPALLNAKQMAKEEPEQFEAETQEGIGNYAKNLLKSGIKGINKLGRVIGPTGPRMPEEKVEAEYEKGLQKLIPSRPSESGFNRGVERIVEALPTNLSLPGGGPAQTAIRTALGGGAAQVTKELGAGETAQAIADITAFISPSLTKKLLETGKNKELIEAAKKLGLNDKQITPLIQSDFKKKWLSKIAAKGSRTQEALRQSKEALGSVYGEIRARPESQKVLEEKHFKPFLDKLGSQMKEIPNNVRDVIIRDVRELFEGPVNADRIINLWQDINANLSGNTKQLSTLKPILQDTLAQISPELANDFGKLNKLYSNYIQMSKDLKQDKIDKILSKGQALKPLVALYTGSNWLLAEFAGEMVGKSIAREMLINPRLQNLKGKLIHAINSNDARIAEKIMRQFGDEIEDIDEETSKKLKKFKISGNSITD